MDWKKTGKTVGPEGTTITYTVEGTPFQIQSRKRHIPHANGDGTWDHTSYFFMQNGVDVKEFWSLKDAKEYVEERHNVAPSDYADGHPLGG